MKVTAVVRPQQLQNLLSYDGGQSPNQGTLAGGHASPAPRGAWSTPSGSLCGFIPGSNGRSNRRTFSRFYSFFFKKNKKKQEKREIFPKFGNLTSGGQHFRNDFLAFEYLNKKKIETFQKEKTNMRKKIRRIRNFRTFFSSLGTALSSGSSISDLYYTEYSQHLRTAGQDLDYLS